MAAGDEDWHTALFVLGLLLFIAVSIFIFWRTSDDYRLRQAKKAVGEATSDTCDVLAACCSCCIGPIRRTHWERQNLLFRSDDYGVPEPDWSPDADAAPAPLGREPAWRRLPRGDGAEQRKLISIAMARAKTQIMQELLEQALVSGINSFLDELSRNREREKQLAAIVAARKQADMKRLQAEDEAQQRLLREQQERRMARELEAELAQEESGFGQPSAGTLEALLLEEDDDAGFETAGDAGFINLISFEDTASPAAAAPSPAAAPTSNGDRPRRVSKTITALEAEYASLESGLPAVDEATKKQIAPFNRLPDRLPTKSTRVSAGKDFFNANRIRGAGNHPGYILTQNPLNGEEGGGKASTLDHFWHVVWQEHCAAIVMLSDKSRCPKYWPSLSQEFSFGGVAISYIESPEVDDCDATLLSLTNKATGEKREVLHLLHRWPTDGRPPRSSGPILGLLGELHDRFSRGEHPLLVHDETGFGAGAVAIGIDFGVYQVEKFRGSFSTPAIVRTLRQQRGGVIETVDQYRFLHQAIRMYSKAIAALPALPEEQKPVPQRKPPPNRPPPAYVHSPSFDEEDEIESSSMFPAALQTTRLDF